MENNHPEPSGKELYEERRAEKLRLREPDPNRRRGSRLGLWVGVFAAVAVVVVIAVIANKPGEDAGAGETATSTPSTVLAVRPDDWTRGSADAPVTLIEYSDFQCSACASYHPVLEQLTAELGPQLQFVYRHFPLRSIHKKADLAGAAAEAAGNQGKFWEMHNKIFENQSKWANARNADEIFISYAQILGLNLDQFKIDLESRVVRDRVDAGYDEALSLGLNSTPTFFVNGKKIVNPRGFEAFRDLLIQAAVPAPTE